MDRWNRIARYPNWLKWLQGLAWLARDPACASGTIDKFWLRLRAQRLTIAAAAISAAAIATPSSAQCTSVPYFAGVGDLPGGETYSGAHALSSDGCTVVGTSFSSSCDTTYAGEAFRWREDIGIIGLGDLPGAYFLGTANAVSADGSSIAGWSSSSNGCDSGTYFGEAFLWTSIAGMIGSGVGAAPNCQSVATGISDDGQILGGGLRVADGTTRMAFWTSDDGWTIVASTDSVVWGISRNGVWLTGPGNFGGGYLATRWSDATGLELLGDLPGGATFAGGSGVSNSGVVVGFSASANGSEAFAWSEATDMVGLDDLAGGAFDSDAIDIAADGSLIVGYGTSDLGQEAVAWDSSLTMIRVVDLLVEHGVCVPGDWTLRAAYEVAINGNIITLCGTATNPDGNTEGWIARYDVTTLTCLGDVNLDSVVNPADLALLLGAWGENPGHHADLNCDGIVNPSDLALLLGAWGPCN